MIFIRKNGIIIGMVYVELVVFETLTNIKPQRISQIFLGEFREKSL
jgi:hypothetical protein